MIYTSDDCVDHLLDYCGGGAEAAAFRDCRRAVTEAYREVADAHRWPYLLKRAIVPCPAPLDGVKLGAVSRDAATGRLVFATPSATNLEGWMIEIILDPAQHERDLPLVEWFRLVCQVVPGQYEVDDSAAFALAIGAIGTNPLVNYRVLTQQFTLPIDFIEMGDVHSVGPRRNGCKLSNVTMDEWNHVVTSRYGLACNSIWPQVYSVGGDSAVPGRLVCRYAPVPREPNYALEFTYRRRPAPILFKGPGSNQGTVSCTAGSNLITAAAGTTFPSMTAVGSVLRLSENATPPSSPVGNQGKYNPAAFEARVKAAPAIGQLIVDRPAPATLAGVGYTLGTPIDFEQGAMIDAFLRCCEKYIASFRAMKVGQTPIIAYQAALALAKGSSSTSYARRVAGDEWGCEPCHRPLAVLAPDYFNKPSVPCQE